MVFLWFSYGFPMVLSHVALEPHAQSPRLQLDVFHYAAAMTAFGHRSWSSALQLLLTARQGMVAVNEYMPLGAGRCWTG